MCGIVGFREGPSIDKPDRLVERMLSQVRLRGPDGEGYLALTGRDSRWHLGHRRLAIIDLVSGDQPMTDEQGEIAVVYNGEIYNFPRLKEELAGQGHVFRTRSDTEVLIHGYSRWGMEGLLSRIEGMFAFALLDLGKEALYLARDPMGQKPLYWAYSPQDGLAFSSSFRAVLEVPWVDREPDRKALQLGVALRHIPAPFSAVKMVRKLPGGTYLSYENGNLVQQSYWHNPSSASGMEADAEECSRQVFSHLVSSVSDCLVSDVPLILLLSSGLDSSLIACALAELGRAKDIAAVTVAFRERSFDESGSAALLAAKLGLRHEIVMLDEVRAQEAVQTTLEVQEEPLADPSLLPTLILSEAVRRLAKVAVGGDGGDELFCGYQTFAATGIHKALGSLPLRNLVRVFKCCLPVDHQRYAKRYALRRFCRGLGLPARKAYPAWLLTGDLQELSSVLEVDGEGLLERVCSFVGDIEEREEIRLMSLQYLRLFLQGVLCKLDTASMHHNLEVRAPFLQPEMIRLALGLPSPVKVRGLRTKYILRRLARDLGLAHHSRLPKQGFNVPLAKWVTGSLRPLIDEYLGLPGLAKTEFFNPSAVTGIWREHLAGKEDHFDLLWSIVSTQKFLLSL